VKRLGELGENDDGFLFGGYSIADAFFWPVLGRFRAYNLPLTTATPETLKWMEQMWNDPVMKKFMEDALKQAEDPESVVEKYDDVFKGNSDIKFGKVAEDWEF